MSGVSGAGFLQYVLKEVCMLPQKHSPLILAVQSALIEVLPEK